MLACVRLSFRIAENTRRVRWWNSNESHFHVASFSQRKWIKFNFSLAIMAWKCDLNAKNEEIEMQLLILVRYEIITRKQFSEGIERSRCGKKSFHSNIFEIPLWKRHLIYGNRTHCVGKKLEHRSKRNSSTLQMTFVGTEGGNDTRRQEFLQIAVMRMQIIYCVQHSIVICKEISSSWKIKCLLLYGLIEIIKHQQNKLPAIVNFGNQIITC